ncbi:MAG TPA: mandelate racemase/muconate lactonizing enzyme family protein [Burkholderiales bacterium]|nr:mandelate racemase/muconate lactonizing enzyme family protein [Burkholderiales bacterium]
MKIAAIETIEVRIPYTAGSASQTSAWGGKEWLTADALLVKVSTDNGITGWGEAFGYNIIPATKVVLDELVTPICLGKDADDIGTLMLDLQRKLHIFGRGGPVMYALSGLDIALWDIAGKARDQPVHQLIGSARREQVETYASLVRYTEPDQVAANVTRACKLGFKHIKLHEITVPAVAAAREAAGPDVGIMLDVNCPWTPDEALDMATQLQPYNLAWLEEPVWPPEDHASLAMIRKRGGIPVAAGENAATLQQYRHLFEAGALDVVQPSPAKSGGISELCGVFDLAKQFGVRVVPHSFYEGPGLLAAIHGSAARSPDPLVEWRFFDTEARLYGEQVVPANGKFMVPQGAGLGYDPDPTVIDRYRVN